jgi:hypothetical protein
MSYEEMEVKDGKVLLYIVFGANRWEFEKLDEEEEDVPEYAQGCLVRLKSTTLYLQKNWKRIAAEDRAIGEAGLTHEIAGVKSCGYSIKGILSYLKVPGRDDGRKHYNAFLRIVKEG